MTTIRKKKKTYLLASTWNELTAHQLRVYSYALQKFKHLLDKNLVSWYYTSVRSYCCYRFLGKPFWFLSISDSDLFFILEKLDWLFGPLRLNKMLFKKIKCGILGSSLIGPDDGLTNCRFWEFVNAERNFYMYNKTGGAMYLDELIATLWRERKYDTLQSDEDYNGDDRTPFNEHLVAERAKKIARLSPHVKQALLINYIGCRNFVIAKFPNAFPSSGTSAKPMDPLMYERMVKNLAGPKFGTPQQVHHEYLFTIMLELEDLFEKELLQANANQY